MEGTIRSGVVRLGIAPSADAARIDVASRTDAGVSARGNVLTVSSPLAGPALLRALNGTAEDIFFNAARRVDESFRVRSATHRIYRYYLSGDEHRIPRLEEGARLLGSTVDVRTFGRGLPVDRASLRPIESIRVHATVRGIWIEVRAPSFVWGMVRKIVGGLLAWESGAIPSEKLRAAARGQERLSLPLAPPDALVLWEVGHLGPWEFKFERVRRHQLRYRLESARRADARVHVLDALLAPEAEQSGEANTSGDPASPPSSARAKQLVRDGWDRVSYRYRSDDADADSFQHTAAEYEPWLRPILDHVSAGAEVLDLGCGCGVPTARRLASRYRVTGVDISDVQIERARTLVPSARFIRADMAKVAFAASTFGAIVALYSMIHLPLDEQRPLFERIYSWLAPRGFFLATLGAEAYTGVQSGWLGSEATMYWSHADAVTYERWLGELGFEPIEQAFVPEEDGGHTRFLVRKPI
ncbi:MAG: methyltransferase domain-containing protein [Thermoplasmata archaeon]|nr:methyltransferase domain-containing protein [Thermoplasmata archaeon]